MTESLPEDKQFGCSLVKTYRVDYEWSIKDFPLLPQNNGEPIYSPIFQSKESGEVQFRLQLYPKGKFDLHPEYVGVFLHLHSWHPESPGMNLYCQLSIRKTGGEDTKRWFVHTYGKTNGYGYECMIPRSDLLKAWTWEDYIIVRCKIDVPQRVISKSLATPIWEEIKDPSSMDVRLTPLYEGFYRLFPELRVSSLTERDLQMLEMVNEDLRKLMIAHHENPRDQPFPGPLPWNTTAAQFMYAMGPPPEEFRLTNFRAMCEKVMDEKIKPDNAADILVFTEFHQFHGIKEGVMAYIDVNLCKVVRSRSYKKMADMYPTLVTELVYRIAKRRERW